MKIVSPLRYPGGKAKFFAAFTALIEDNRLLGCGYREPFAGGAGLAILLLCHGYVDRIVLNDIDAGVASFWKQLISDPDDLCRRISSCSLSIEEWRRQRQIYDDATGFGNPELAFATFFLNRTSRSGIIAGAGPIGGYAQAGKWKIDARFNADALIANITRLARFSGKIEVTNEDALDCLAKSTRGELIYIDPPYYEKGQRLYRNFYNHSDHVEIQDAILKCKTANWVVSYDAVAEIRDLYKDFSPHVVELFYSAGKHRTAKELVYLSESLKVPKLWASSSQCAA